MPVRSDFLARGTLTHGAGSVITTVATVPAGETWIIKDESISNDGATAVSPQLFAGGVRVQHLSLAGLSTYRQMGFLVLNPGDLLQIRTLAAATLSYYFSGARLLGVA